METLTIKFKGFKAIDTDLRKCMMCEDVIYSKVHVACMSVNDKQQVFIDKVSLCDSCKNIYDTGGGSNP